MFSRRTQWNLEESDLARAYRERLEAGLPTIDLTLSNPTRCGFEYPPDLLEPLISQQSRDYDPNPKGRVEAREAICGYYSDLGSKVDIDHIVLTTSTSEAYAYLFKLLCDPGHEVLVPQPSYPLFDFLADAESVSIIAVPLVYDQQWLIDMQGLRSSISPKTRAIVLVHPNNPTGHFLTLEQSRELAQIAKQNDLALIVDEVFLDYRFEHRDASPSLPCADEKAESCNFLSFTARDLDALVFVVSGLSKIAGLPQMKVAWLVAIGPGSTEAMRRLEVLADTFLSMNAPMQAALPFWVKNRGSLQEQIRARTRANLAQLDQAINQQELAERMVNRLEVEGGWYVVVRIPAIEEDEKTVVDLLNLGVWVHPGFYFGFGRKGRLVLSLLAPQDQFLEGVLAILRYFSPILPLNH